MLLQGFKLVWLLYFKADCTFLIGVVDLGTKKLIFTLFKSYFSLMFLSNTKDSKHNHNISA